MTGRRALVAGLAAGGAGAVAVAAYDPFASHAVGCPFLSITGWYCPGCGATRATWLLLHGDLGGVVAMNALLLPALAYLVARWVHLVAPERTDWLPRFVRAPTEVSPLALRVVALLLVAFAVARNLPAFDFLAPDVS